jgi:phage I-like protein
VSDPIKQEIELLHTGKFSSPAYGDFEVTEQDLEEMVKEFDASEAAGRRAIDFDHKGVKGDTKAAGWIEKIWRDGSHLKALVEWTGSGVEALQRRDYRFVSAEYAQNWRGKQQGAEIQKTKKLRGATLTNRPFQELLAPVTLSDDPNAEQHFSCDPVLLHDLQVTPKMTHVTAPIQTSSSSSYVTLGTVATTNTTMERDMPESIREVLALSETATDEEIVGAVRQLVEAQKATPDLSGYVALSEHKALQTAFDAVKTSAEESASKLRDMERERFFSEHKAKYTPAESESLIALFDVNPEAVKALLEARPVVQTGTIGYGESRGARSVDSAGLKDEHRLGLHEAAQRLLDEGKAKNYGEALILVEKEN